MNSLHERCRAFGEERIEALARCKEPGDFQKLWPAGKADWPFTWGECWKAVPIIHLEDYAAELGFFVDVLGFQSFATWEGGCFLAAPESEFKLGLADTREGTAVDPASFQLDLMVGNIEEAAATLVERGVIERADLHPEWGEEQRMRTLCLKSPNGISLKLWGNLAGEAPSGDTAGKG